MDNMVKKKIKIILRNIVIVAVFFILIKVAFADNFVNKLEIKHNCTEMIEAIVAEDISAVLERFSEAVQMHYKDVGCEDIRQLITFFCDNSLKCEYMGSSGYLSSSDYGQLKYYCCFPKFKAVASDGRVYTVKLTYEYKWKEWPIREGISEILLTTDDGIEVIRVGKIYN